MSVHHFAVLLFTILSLFISRFAGAHPCSEKFEIEAVAKRNMTDCMKKTLGAEFGWRYHNVTNTLDIVFGARLDSDMGWLAWGLNPGKEPRMEGTRALIGIKLGNRKLLHNTYNVTHFTKVGCGLQPSKNIDLDVRSFTFFYEEQTGFHIIEASIVLSPEYNISRMNLVWQIGKATAGMEPKMHPRKLANVDSTETMDLVSGLVVNDVAQQWKKLSEAHGILNIVGWGILLPIGVIIARYFRRYPEKDQIWYQCHICCQMLGWSIGTAGWILGMVLGNASKYYSFPIHRILGIIIFTFTTLQGFALRVKPPENDKYRIHWDIYHHFLGYALLAIISVNIFKGIAILSADNWKWAYIGILGVLGLTAIALESRIWIKFLYLDKPEEKPKTPQNSSGNPKDPQSSESKFTTAGTGLESQLHVIQPSSSFNLERS